MVEKKTSKIRNILLSSVVLVILVLAGYEYIRYQEQYPSTDDAYIHGNILYIAPQISGQLIEVNVTDFQHVDKGMVVVRIDPAVYQARLEQAKAAYEAATSSNKASSDAILGASTQIRTASAQLSDIQEKYRRNIALVERGVLSKQTGDDLKAELVNAQNALDLSRTHMQQLISEQGTSGKDAPIVKQAAAALSEAALNLSYTEIAAPVSGKLGSVKVRPGSVLAAGQAMMPLIEDNVFWVDANYKEDAIGKIKASMKAKITLDMYPDTIFTGEVVAISPASGSSFSLLPPENATGNWVKIPQRFPVRLSIKAKANQPVLRVGASATVTIDLLRKDNIDGKQQ